jgi:diguanylate cyclase (GGDEF)-like protein
MSQPQPRPRILVIDDTPVDLQVLATALAADFAVQIATSGAMGLALAAKAIPDLILLDVLMPEMDGYEVCRRLKADPKLQHIPVIFISAMSGLEAETAGFALGACDYITKPIRVERARLRISNLLEREALRTALGAKQIELEQIAHYDHLTGLPNRVLLADRMEQALTQALRRGEPLAVAFLDLDGFKAINDRHGHAAGDHLLITVATRMKQALRDSDTLARLGGDEFVAVLQDLNNIAVSAPMLQRLLTAASEPVHFGDLVLQVSASLGVTFYPQAEDVASDQLLRQADQAMYQAKLAGKNRFHVFDAEQDRNIRSHQERLARLRQALLQHEFVLHYQPTVNLRSGKVVGMEALIRWQHPQKGLLPCTDFLPLIQDSPLAVELGHWVLDTVLTQIEHWRETGLVLPVSVNIGTQHLRQPDFALHLRQLLSQHPSVKASQLVLEVLESCAVSDPSAVSSLIDDCRKIGVLFTLDDFGSGHSSLTCLKKLPVAQVKIYQSFVAHMLDDRDDQAILRSVIGLIKALGREVIAEGVESTAHGLVLLEMGCELGQGYAIAPAMATAELANWVKTWRPWPEWVNAPIPEPITAG